jgi:single cache domain-containing protein
LVATGKTDRASSLPQHQRPDPADPRHCVNGVDPDRVGICPHYRQHYPYRASGAGSAVTEAATEIVESFENRAAKGELSETIAQEAAKAVLRAVRYDGTEYVTIRAINGEIFANDMFKDREGC